MAMPLPSRPKRCTHLTAVPLPADDCDRPHSMHAALASLAATTTAFDAVMDAISDATARHRLRVEKLERRMARFREHMKRLDEVAASKMQNGELDDRVCMVYCPSSYEDALEGMGRELDGVKDELDANAGETSASLQSGMPSTRDAVRAAADAAVQKALLQDVQLDNGQAVPSDAWLDSATTGLGVGKALEVTDQQRLIPPLAMPTGDAEYQRALDMLLMNASTTKRDDAMDRLESLEGPPGGVGRGDDESVYSVTSQMSAISMASSTRLTAAQRRRHHRQQQMQKGKLSASQSQLTPPALPTHIEGPSQPSTAAAGRQQSSAGSQPYLCENFHDSYGIGTVPPAGLVDCSGFSSKHAREGGTEFYPPPGDVSHLLVFNTARNSYGPARAAAPVARSQPPAATAPANEGVDGAERLHSSEAAKRMDRVGRDALDSNSASLANLVFQADATAEAKAKPALDLPTSLPQEGLSG